MKIPSLPFLFFTLLAFGGCVSTQKGADVHVGYYNVKGTSFEELDREIALHGPRVAGVGKAIASTRVKMIPDVRFMMTGGKCRITQTKVRVIADITLPRLTDRNKVDKRLQQAFSNIEEYARLHEAVHVDIAREHAKLAEQQISGLNPQPDCTAMKNKVVETFSAAMREHEKAQLAFDARENRRFASN